MAEPVVKPEEEIEDVDDMEEGGEGDVGDSKAAEVASQLMKNPEVLAALQGKLGSMVGTPSGYIQSLPKVVKRRLKALKKLQFKTIEIESKFYEEVHELECKYAAQYAPLFQRRKEVVNGGIEPTDSDCDWPSDEEDEEDELADDLQSKAKLQEVDETKEKQDKEVAEKEEENVSGVPEFWLTIFKNVEMLTDMIQDHDEPILKNLQDIQVKFSKSNPMGFTLEFIFSPNEFFSNTILTKEYIMRCEPDSTEPFSYEGPEIIKCKGCTIDWSKGKDVTVKVIKKTQKHRGRGTKRVITKTVQNDSFFNFFNPPELPEGDAVPDEETEQLLGADFEIGHFLRERVVPRAVLYFTGEALDDDDEYDEEEGEEEEDGEDDGDEDDDADADFEPQKGQNPGECKQQ